MPDGQGALTPTRELLGHLAHLPVADEQLAAVMRWYAAPFGRRQSVPTDDPGPPMTSRQDRRLPGGDA
ncbi:hypothetical protein [Streptomyces platensis]|uniref:hypothetical protein n=1 Tax=Streptomyces platensis TaxID=58346 RepID=UPI00386E4B3D|nr:hypothetical protein OG962_36365 [Streptomyces platensis]